MLGGLDFAGDGAAGDFAALVTEEESPVLIPEAPGFLASGAGAVALAFESPAFDSFAAFAMPRVAGSSSKGASVKSSFSEELFEPARAAAAWGPSSSSSASSSSLSPSGQLIAWLTSAADW